MFIKTPYRDVILPLVEASQTGNNDFRYERFHGTCFLIGDRGFAITNSHLLGTSKNNYLGVLIVNSKNQWEFVKTEKTESHPHEDIAILKLETPLAKSFFKIASARQPLQSLTYSQFSYPDDETREIEKDGYIQNRPDLVYFRGYIRRRISHSIPGIRGSGFFELSESASLGCSGSPVFKKLEGSHDEIIGVYVGNNSRESQGRTFSVGYCIPSDLLTSWKPSILGREIKEEA